MVAKKFVALAVIIPVMVMLFASLSPTAIDQLAEINESQFTQISGIPGTIALVFLIGGGILVMFKLLGLL